MDLIREITLQRCPVKNYPVRTGDTVRAHIKVKEGGKERVQIFEGVILKIQGPLHTRSITIRKISDGVGVEKTIPLASPALINVETVSRAKVRRARLFYLRKLKGRAARLTAHRFTEGDKKTGQEADSSKSNSRPSENSKK